MHLETEISQSSVSTAVITLRGRLSLGSNLSLLQAQIASLIDKGLKKLVLDLTEVEHLDSASLGMLIHTSGTLQSLGGELRISGPNEHVAALFRLTGTEKLLHLFATKGEALVGLDSYKPPLTSLL